MIEHVTAPTTAACNAQKAHHCQLRSYGELRFLQRGASEVLINQIPHRDCESSTQLLVIGALSTTPRLAVGSGRWAVGSGQLAKRLVPKSVTEQDVKGLQIRKVDEEDRTDGVGVVEQASARSEMRLRLELRSRKRDPGCTFAQRQRLSVPNTVALHQNRQPRMQIEASNITEKPPLRLLAALHTQHLRRPPCGTPAWARYRRSTSPTPSPALVQSLSPQAALASRGPGCVSWYPVLRVELTPWFCTMGDWGKRRTPGQGPPPQAQRLPSPSCLGYEGVGGGRTPRS